MFFAMENFLWYVVALENVFVCEDAFLVEILFEIIEAKEPLAQTIPPPSPVPSELLSAVLPTIVQLVTVVIHSEASTKMPPPSSVAVLPETVQLVIFAMSTLLSMLIPPP